MQKTSHRTEKINQLIFREINIILRNNTKDPRLQSLQVTEVISSKDLSSSKIFFSCNNKDLKNILLALKKAKSFIRTNIAKNLKLRHTPELIFRHDDSAEKFNTIENILKDINAKD